MFTHDQIEAMTLADRIAVLREGVVEQFGTPAELYAQPDNIFVAGFIGSPKMNFIDAAVADVSESAAFTKGKMSIRTSKVKQVRTGQKIILGMRPEHVSLDGKQTRLTLRADISENRGTTQIHAMASTGESVVILASGRPDIVLGQPLSAAIAAANIYLFNEEGAAL